MQTGRLYNEQISKQIFLGETCHPTLIVKLYRALFLTRTAVKLVLLRYVRTGAVGFLYLEQYCIYMWRIRKINWCCSVVLHPFVRSSLPHVLPINITQIHISLCDNIHCKLNISLHKKHIIHIYIILRYAAITCACYKKMRQIKAMLQQFIIYLY